MPITPKHCLDIIANFRSGNKKGYFIGWNKWEEYRIRYTTTLA